MPGRRAAPYASSRRWPRRPRGAAPGQVVHQTGRSEHAGPAASVPTIAGVGPRQRDVDHGRDGGRPRAARGPSVRGHRDAPVVRHASRSAERAEPSSLIAGRHSRARHDRAAMSSPCRPDGRIRGGRGTSAGASRRPGPRGRAGRPSPRRSSSRSRRRTRAASGRTASIASAVSARCPDSGSTTVDPAEAADRRRRDAASRARTRPPAPRRDDGDRRRPRSPASTGSSDGPSARRRSTRGRRRRAARRPPAADARDRGLERTPLPRATADAQDARTGRERARGGVVLRAVVHHDHARHRSDRPERRTVAADPVALVPRGDQGHDVGHGERRQRFGAVAEAVGAAPRRSLQHVDPEDQRGAAHAEIEVVDRHDGRSPSAFANGVDERRRRAASRCPRRRRPSTRGRPGPATRRPRTRRGRGRAPRSSRRRGPRRPVPAPRCPRRPGVGRRDEPRGEQRRRGRPSRDPPSRARGPDARRVGERVGDVPARPTASRPSASRAIVAELRLRLRVGGRDRVPSSSGPRRSPRRRRRARAGPRRGRCPRRRRASTRTTPRAEQPVADQVRQGARPRTPPSPRSARRSSSISSRRRSIVPW